MQRRGRHLQGARFTESKTVAHPKMAISATSSAGGVAPTRGGKLHGSTVGASPIGPTTSISWPQCRLSLIHGIKGVKCTAPPVDANRILMRGVQISHGCRGSVAAAVGYLDG